MYLPYNLSIKNTILIERLYCQGYGFSSIHVWMWELDYKESWALKKWCFWTVLSEKTLESLLNFKEIQPVHPEGDQSWVFIERTDVEAENSNILTTWCEELTHCKRPWCWERLRAGREEDDRGWDGCMASPTQWTWVWVDSGSWWWTGRPGVLWFIASQRITHDWVTKVNWTAFSKSMLNIWKFMVHVLLKPGLENFDHYFTSVWDEFSCAVVWTFFGVDFLWDWNENWHFPVPWPLINFSDLLAYWVQYFHRRIFRIWNSN